MTYGQWVSYYAYTGSSDITYSDTNVQPSLFQASTVDATAQIAYRVYYGDYIANTPYTGSNNRRVRRCLWNE